MEHASTRPALRYADAVRDLLDQFAWNPWFLNSYWPENEPRIRVVADGIRKRFPPGSRVLDVGCANGYVAYLLSAMGYVVSAVDNYDDAKRAELFDRHGIAYARTNLNAVSPLAEFPPRSYDLVLLGEVFEHILNQPAGLLRAIFSVLRPGGALVLTTPNPSTVMNALRLLGDRYVLWGTDVFLRDTKLDGEHVIDRGDIHYREYPLRIVRDLMSEIGFGMDGTTYVRFGVAPSHSFRKRLAKQGLHRTGLGGLRLFSPGYVIWGRKPLDS